MVISHHLYHEDKILLDFGIFNSVPKVLDQIHCIVEHNCFYGMYSVTSFLQLNPLSLTSEL